MEITDYAQTLVMIIALGLLGWISWRGAFGKSEGHDRGSNEEQKEHKKLDNSSKEGFRAGFVLSILIYSILLYGFGAF